MPFFNCVLLVDDDGVTNFINHRLVKKLNITSRIESAVNGNDALAFLKDFAQKNEQAGPELIFLDMNMPVLSGPEFVSHFEKLQLKNKQNIRLVMLSAGINPKENKRIAPEIQEKSDAIRISYLDKPLTEEKLIQLLELKPQAGENNS